MATESVRVICRFRPARSELLRGGGQGGSKVAEGKGGLGHISKSPATQRTGTTGFHIEFDSDGKSLTYTAPSAVRTQGDRGDKIRQKSQPQQRVTELLCQSVYLSVRCAG